MRGKLGRSLAVCLLSSAPSLALASSSPATVTIGSNLRAPASASEGICALAGATAASRCTDAQATLSTGHAARGGLTAPAAGTILRWSVLSGTASPGTASVKLRLRVLEGNDAVGDASAYVELPLAQPGIHSFSTRLPVERGDRLAVESIVKSSGGGPAYAPIGHFEPAIGSIDEWIYPASPGLRLPPDSTREGVELLLSAEIDTDRSPPRTKLTYPQRQDFLATKEVLVRFRSNEDATVFASGQLEFPNGKRGAVIYGLYGKQRLVEGGEKTTLRLRLPRKTWEAAVRAQKHFKRIVVKVTVSAEDAAGNRSGTTVAAIRPKP
jgi:hypothetical protein